MSLKTCWKSFSCNEYEKYPHGYGMCKPGFFCPSEQTVKDTKFNYSTDALGFII